MLESRGSRHMYTMKNDKFQKLYNLSTKKLLSEPKDHHDLNLTYAYENGMAMYESNKQKPRIHIKIGDMEMAHLKSKWPELTVKSPDDRCAVNNSSGVMDLGQA